MALKAARMMVDVLTDLAAENRSCSMMRKLVALRELSDWKMLPAPFIDEPPPGARAPNHAAPSISKKGDIGLSVDEIDDGDEPRQCPSVVVAKSSNQAADAVVVVVDTLGDVGWWKGERVRVGGGEEEERWTGPCGERVAGELTPPRPTTDRTKQRLNQRWGER